MGISGIAAVASLASAGFGAAGSVVSGQGTAAGDTYKAETLDRAATYGGLKATQTGAQLTRNLSVSLGNIDAIRAAARTDPTSPTGAAVRGYTEQVGTEQKTFRSIASRRRRRRTKRTPPICEAHRARRCCPATSVHSPVA
jgi:hypothetical protein